MSRSIINEEYRSNTALIIAAGAMLSGVAFFLFAMSPDFVERFRLLSGVSDRTANAVLWLLPAVGAGIAFGGAALGLLTLVRLVRELQENPFAWLAPLLAVFSAFMISGVQFEMPITAVNKSHFAVLSAIIFVVLSYKFSAIYAKDLLASQENVTAFFQKMDTPIDVEREVFSRGDKEVNVFPLVGGIAMGLSVLSLLILFVPTARTNIGINFAVSAILFIIGLSMVLSKYFTREK